MVPLSILLNLSINFPSSKDPKTIGIYLLPKKSDFLNHREYGE
jgi:hypothetical protein